MAGGMGGAALGTKEKRTRRVVKVTWSRADRGSEDEPEVRRRLVAQELGYAGCVGELFVGTSSLAVVKILLSVAAVMGLTPHVDPRHG